MQSVDEVVQGTADHLFLACWNWALTGFAGDGVYPQQVFSYVGKRRVTLEKEDADFDGAAWINFSRS